MYMFKPWDDIDIVEADVICCGWIIEEASLSDQETLIAFIIVQVQLSLDALDVLVQKLVASLMASHLKINRRAVRITSLGLPVSQRPGQRPLLHFSWPTHHGHNWSTAMPSWEHQLPRYLLSSLCIR